MERFAWSRDRARTATVPNCFGKRLQAVRVASRDSCWLARRDLTRRCSDGCARGAEAPVCSPSGRGRPSVEADLPGGCELPSRRPRGRVSHPDGPSPLASSAPRRRAAGRQRRRTRGVAGNERASAAGSGVCPSRPPGSRRPSHARSPSSAHPGELGPRSEILRAMHPGAARGDGTPESRRWIDHRSPLRDPLRPGAPLAHRRSRLERPRLLPDVCRSASARSSHRGHQAGDARLDPCRGPWSIAPADTSTLHPARGNAALDSSSTGAGPPRGRPARRGGSRSRSRRARERLRQPPGVVPRLPSRARGHPGGPLARNTPATVSPTGARGPPRGGRSDVTTCQRSGPRPEPEHARGLPLATLTSRGPRAAALRQSRCRRREARLRPRRRGRRPPGPTPPTDASSAAAARRR
jgi:hypothetical protein